MLALCACWDRPGSCGKMACGSGAWAPWTWPWAGLVVLGMRRLPGGRSKGRRGCRAHSPAEEGGPCAEWRPAGLGWGLPAPECPAQGHTLLLTSSWTRHCGASDGKGGVYQGPAGVQPQLGQPHLCPCGWERPPLTCLPPCPAGGPEPQEAPGRAGERRGSAGAETRHDKAKPKSAPAPSPHPHASLSGPRAACRNCSLGAGLRNAIER